MIRFEVTGATPEEFVENAMKAWALLAIGLQAALAQVSSPSSAAALSQSKVETSGSENSSTASKVAKPATTVHSDKVDDLFTKNDTNSALAPSEISSATSKPAAKKSTKGPKLDDLKTRLSEVIVAATERWDQKRANAYARQLIGRFGAKLSDVKPTDYEFFMKLSDGYLSGELPEA